MFESLDEVLAHYGVKGMKWGVHRTDAQLARAAAREVTLKETPGRKVRASGGQGHAPSDDAKSAAISRQKAKKSTTDSLSNKELKDLVHRMNLEQQYSDLMSKRVDTPAQKANKFIKSFLGVGKTMNEVIAFQNSPAGKQLKSELGKRVGGG